MFIAVGSFLFMSGILWGAHLVYEHVSLVISWLLRVCVLHFGSVPARGSPAEGGCADDGHAEKLPVILTRSKLEQTSHTST